MRRIKLFLTVFAVMALMLATTAAPAFAKPGITGSGPLIINVGTGTSAGGDGGSDIDIDGGSGNVGGGGHTSGGGSGDVSFG